MYRLIRATAGYNSVIVVEPPDAALGDSNAVYFEMNLKIDAEGRSGWKEGAFNKISQCELTRVFANTADSWGFAKHEIYLFRSLEAAQFWVKEKRENRGTKGVWYLEWNEFDHLENELSRAVYTQKVALAATTEDEAVNEAKNLWAARLERETYHCWDGNDYPCNPHVFFYHEVPWSQ